MNSDKSGQSWPPGMKIVNDHLANNIRQQGMLREPNSFGYVYLAAEIERPHPLKKNSPAKKALLDGLKALAATLRQSEPSDVQRADVFDAFVIPVGASEGREVLQKANYDVHIAEFDVVVLVDCTNVDAAVRVRESTAFKALKSLLDEKANYVHCVVAKNTKRIGEVDKTRNGLFLFNYFFAADIASKGATVSKLCLGYGNTRPAGSRPRPISPTPPCLSRCQANLRSTE